MLLAIAIAQSVSSVGAIQAKQHLPIPPKGTYVSLTEQYYVQSGLGGGWVPNGVNGGPSCVNNKACRAPSGTFIAPAGYRFCVADANSWKISSSGVSFDGFANLDGTLSYNSSFGTNVGIDVRANLLYVSVNAAPVWMERCINPGGYAWQCASGKCQFTRPPHLP